MLRSIFFDFNGVLVDDEHIHWELMQKILLEKNIALDKQEYYQKYVGLTDQAAFTAILQEHGIASTCALLQQLIVTKAHYYQLATTQHNLFLPGAEEFVKKVAAQYATGIVSGALRAEIDMWMSRAKLHPFFQVIVSCEDVRQSKPDPEGYLLALEKINQHRFTKEVILPQQCLVIEDSLKGIAAAKAAGMKCAALTSSYPKDALKNADWVFDNFAQLQEKLKLPPCPQSRHPAA